MLFWALIILLSPESYLMTFICWIRAQSELSSSRPSAMEALSTERQRRLELRAYCTPFLTSEAYIRSCLCLPNLDLVIPTEIHGPGISVSCLNLILLIDVY